MTIATNMAGRGTDIMLGGNSEYLAKAEMRRMQIREELISEATGFAETDDQEILDARRTFTELDKKYKEEIAEEAEKVRQAGGLFIIGTERHESRRIDNQLRGRSGRQGDPGSTQFYLSLEDDLMRIFGADNISRFMDKLGMEEDEPIEHSMITKSIEKAQKKVEAHNFEIRKYVLEYDDVMNQQREVLYAQRRKVLTSDSLKETILGMIDDIILDGLTTYANEKLYPEEWDFAGLLGLMEQYFVPKGSITVAELENLSRPEVQEKLTELAVDLYDRREAEIGSETMRELEKAIMLRVVDSKWMDHLDAMDALKEGINLRAYGQKNPIVEYKFEAYEMFEEMVESIKRTVVTFLYHVQVTFNRPVPQAEDHLQGAKEIHADSDTPGGVVVEEESRDLNTTVTDKEKTEE